MGRPRGPGVCCRPRPLPNPQSRDLGLWEEFARIRGGLLACLMVTGTRPLFSKALGLPEKQGPRMARRGGGLPESDRGELPAWRLTHEGKTGRPDPGADLARMLDKTSPSGVEGLHRKDGGHTNE